uniref:B30.2/SPRY domain-containing protein n=1 Tax=Oncorhynchus mykiss TaxID=8022 RepID=A0A8K9XHS4_ONCMY
MEQLPLETYGLQALPLDQPPAWRCAVLVNTVRYCIYVLYVSINLGGGGGGGRGGGEDRDHQDPSTIEREWMDTKTQLHMSEAEIHQLILQRQRKMEEIRSSLAQLQLSVERETAGVMCVFSALVCAVERSQAELMEVIEMSRRLAEHKADDVIRQLEQEVNELRKRSHALSQLAQSDDYVHCKKTYPALCTPPPIRDWSGVSVNSDLGTGPIYTSLSVLVQRFQEEISRMVQFGEQVPLESSPIPQPKVKRVQEYAVDVTMDSSTAHPRLILSGDGKMVKCGDRHQPVPNNSERFDRVVCVLGREGFSSGQHYWEVGLNIFLNIVLILDPHLAVLILDTHLALLILDPHLAVLILDPHLALLILDPHLPGLILDPYLTVLILDHHVAVLILDPHLAVLILDPHLALLILDPHVAVLILDSHLAVLILDPHLALLILDPHLAVLILDSHLAVLILDPHLAVLILDSHLAVLILDHHVAVLILDPHLAVNPGSSFSLVDPGSYIFLFDLLVCPFMSISCSIWDRIE